MSKKHLFLIVLPMLVVALIVAGFWYFQKENSRSQSNITNDNDKEEIQNIGPENQSDQREQDLVWYEIPEFDLRFQVTPREKEQYDKIRLQLEERGEQLVWYQVPELDIEFLVTPDAKKDLRYVSGEVYKNDIKYIDTIYFYSQSFIDFMDDCSIKYEDNGSYRGNTAECSHFAISRISNQNILEYEKIKRRLFCGTIENRFIVGNYYLCQEHGPDSLISRGVEKYEEYMQTRKDKLDEHLFKTSRLLRQ